MGCNNFQTEQTDKLVEASLRGENSGIQSCPREIREEWERVAPAVQEKLRAMDEAEAKSKKDLVKQSEKAEHIHIETDPEDYPKAVHAIPVRGFDVSKEIDNQEMRDRLRNDPMMQVHQRFFPGKITSLDYTGRREIGYRIKDGKPHIGPVLGATIINPDTGEKRIEINEHHEKDMTRPESGPWTTKEELQKMSLEQVRQTRKAFFLGTYHHEAEAHVFGEDMLGEEAKTELGDLFENAKAKEAFVSPRASANKWEYLGEGWAWYSDPEHRAELEKKDPGLYSFIKETEEECKKFIEISKNLILVRGEKR